jgi:hypothetical protein
VKVKARQATPYVIVFGAELLIGLLLVLVAWRIKVVWVDHDKPYVSQTTVTQPHCMMEPSDTPEGYEIIKYDRLWPDDDYEGFTIPCP